MAGKGKKRPPQFRAQVHELPKEIVERDPKLPIYKNGVDNLYPERIERVINNSPTAKGAIKLAIKYTLCKGIPGINDQVINEKDQVKGYKYLRNIVQSYWYQKGVFVHVMWTPVVDGQNVTFEISSQKVIPYKYCRIGKKDNKGYFGKIAVYEHWDEDSINKEKVQLVDVFNPNPKVISSQINQCKGKNLVQKAKAYKGQILYINPENSEYPLAHIDEAYEHADSEYRAALYINTLMRQGFVGTDVWITPPLEGDYSELTDSEFDALDEAEKAKVSKVRSEAEDVRKMIKSSKGVENAGSTVLLEMEPGGSVEKISDALHIHQFESKIDDKKFKATEETAARQIRKAINQIPGILLDQSDSSLFGNSGELLKQAKIAFQEQCEEDRMIIEEAVKTLLKYSKDFKEVDVEIEKLITEEKPKPVEDGAD